MPNYCVNKNPQTTGEHEVHNLDTCNYLPDVANRQNLSWHSNCHSAVAEAKKYYNNVDGCAYCCRECHTR